MQIYSRLLRATIDLDGYVNTDTNIILKHSALDQYARDLGFIDSSYEIISSEMDHSVVLCTLTYRGPAEQGILRTATALGETSKGVLSGSFENYPTMTAMEMAIDRAMIKLLVLPSNTYSVLEFLRNCDTANISGTFPGNTDVAGRILSFGPFANRSYTVRKAFEIAQKDPQSRATLDIYLSKNISEEKDPLKRDDLIAIKRYANEINWNREDRG